MKTNIFFHAACIMIIIFSVTLVYFFTKPKILLENNLCKSTVSYKLDDSSHNFEYNIFINLNFTNTGKGYEHMRGVVIKDGTKYTLARNINSSYQVRNNNNYEITINDVSKLGQDNVPEDLISQYFTYTLPNSFTVIKINEIGNNLILVSGLQGPVFICSLL